MWGTSSLFAIVYGFHVALAGTGRARDGTKPTLESLKGDAGKRVYTLEYARDVLRFTFDPLHPKSKEEVRAMKDCVTRSRACHPNEKREKLAHNRTKHYITLGETNGQFVEKELAKQRDYNYKTMQRETELRDRLQRQTGQRPISRNSTRTRQRKAVALSGDPNERMRIRNRQGEWIDDPQKRTKYDYYTQVYSGRGRKAQGGPKTVKPFDLNEPPPPE